MPASTMIIDVPTDFVLARDACSYGYFLLEPNHWVPTAGTFTRVLNLPAGATCAIITQPGAKPKARGFAASRGRPLRVELDRRLGQPDKRALTAQLTRMLRLDEDAAHVRGFHRVDPRWKTKGHGRLLRSPTLFEDVIKTVTNCNVTWLGTMNMNRRLCEVLGAVSPSGRPGFPTPESIAAQRPAFLRGRCGVGYRDARIVELARMFIAGDLGGQPPAFFEDPRSTDAQVREALLELPGIGPYAASNVMQLLGRYGHIPLDTETVRHGKTVLGMKGSSKAIMKRVDKHFGPFAQHKFRSYWFELWQFYEVKRGPAHTWEKEIVGKSFTAAQM